MANSAVVGLLRVLLTANTAEFSSAMKSASASAQAWSKDMKSIGQQATQLGSALTKTLTVPLLAIGAGSAKLAMDFESSFAGVRKTVNASEAEFAQMSQAFRDLAKTIPVNVNELNRLGEAAGALGIPKAEVVDFAKTMALLGVTTNVTSDQAAESIAKIQNIFGAAGKDTDRFASTLVALGNDGASTESQILEMATRIAGAGNAIGLTQGQVLGFASALSSVGIEAEMGGSAISRVFIDIASNVSSGGEKLNEFARVSKMSTEEFSKAFKTDAAGAVNAFISGLGDIKKAGGDLLGTLEGLGFSEIRVRDTLLRTAGAGDLLARALKLQGKAWSENTALMDEARKRFETTESQLKLLWNRIEDVGITLGNAFLPAIQSASAALSALLPVIDALAKSFSVLPGWAQLLVIGFGTIVAAAGPALYLFGQLALSASALIGVFGKKGLATRALGEDLKGLETVSGATSRGLAALGKAASVASVAFVGWEIGRLIADLFGLDQKIADTITGINNLRRARDLTAQGKGAEANADVSARLLDLERQRTAAIQAHNLAQAQLLETQIAALRNDSTRLAIQDTINLAIKRGAAETVTYTEAVRFNQDWLAKQKTAHVEVAAAATTHSKALSGLAQLNATYATDLKKIGESGFKEIQTAHEKFGQSIKDLATQYHVAESSIDHYIESHKSGAKAIDAHARALQGLADKYSGALLARQVADLSKVLRMLPSGTDLKPLADEIGRLFKEGAQLTPELMQIGVAFGTLLPKVTEGIRDFSEFGETVSDITIPAKRFSELLPKVEYGIEDLIKELPKLDLGYQFETAKPKAEQFRNTLSDLAQALSQLGQIAGGAFGEIARGLATLVGAADTAKQSLKSLREGQDEWKKGSTFAGILDMTTGVLGLVSAALTAGKALANLFDRNKGRDLVVDFAETFGGFDALHEKLLTLGEAGEALWIKLTQGVGRNNPAQARAVIDEVTAALNKQESQQDETTAATEEQAQATIETASQAAQALDELGDKLRTNEDDWARWSETVTGEIQQIADALRGLNIPSPSASSGGGGGEEAPGAYTGGIMEAGRIIASRFGTGGIAGRLVQFSPRGADRYPAMLADGEGVLNRRAMAALGAANLHALNSGRLSTLGSGIDASAGPMQSVAILEVDGREFARAMVPVYPGETRRYGVRVRAS